MTAALVLAGLLAVLMLTTKADAASAPAPAPSAEPLPRGRDAFKAWFYRHAANVDFKGLQVKIGWAMASFETGDASSNSVFVNGRTNNPFNITAGSSWSGPTYHGFRVYETPEDGIRAWVELMHSSYYKPALPFGLAGDYKNFYAAVKKLGYDATNPNYAQLVAERYEGVA